MLYADDAESAIAELKEFSFKCSFFLTIARQAEQDIAEAILLSKQYQRCLKHAADAVLKEVIELHVDQGTISGVQELRRQECEAVRLRGEREALEARRKELEGERADLAAERALVEVEQEELRKREMLVNAHEDLEEKRRLLEQQISQFQQSQAQEQRVIKEQRAYSLADIAARTQKVEALAAQVAKERSTLQRSVRKWFWLKLSACGLMILLLLAPIRDILVKPYLATKEDVTAEKSSLGQQQERLKERELGLESRRVQLTRSEKRVADWGRQLDWREAEVNERQEELNSQAARIEAAFRSQTQQIQQNQIELADKERAVEQRAAQLANQAQQFEQRMAELRTRERQIASVEEARRQKVEEAAGEVTATVVNSDPRVIDTQVVINGTPIMFSGPGSRTFSLRKGRYPYSVNARFLRGNGIRSFAIAMSGSGYLDVVRDNQRFVVSGRYPRLWITPY